MDQDSRGFQVEDVEGACVVTLSGSLNDSRATQLKAAFNEVVEDEPERLIVDLRTVNYLSSAGIALFVGLLSRCRQRSVELGLCGLREDVLQIFKLTRLNQIFAIYEDRDTALAELTVA